MIQIPIELFNDNTKNYNKDQISTLTTKNETYNTTFGLDKIYNYSSNVNSTQHMIGPNLDENGNLEVIG